MSGWGTFWHWVIGTSLVAYFGLAVLIAIGGFFDVKKMFRRLNEAHIRDKGGLPVIEDDTTRGER